VSRLLERDMFQSRLKEGKEIYLHEFLYPIFQAYDSVTMDVDMEIGGNDQTFNMLAGRTLMKKMKNKEKFVLTTKLLIDPSGKKMGKTEGNMINLDEAAEAMYGKIMSWPDKLIGVAFEICTGVTMVEVAKIKDELKAGKVNPRDLKMRLAYEVVKIYHGEKVAAKAQENFIKVFQKKELPEEIKIVEVKNFGIIKDEVLAGVLLIAGLATSKSEAKRLILQGGIRVNNEIVKDINYKITELRNEILIQRGKGQFIKIKIKKV